MRYALALLIAVGLAACTPDDDRCAGVVTQSHWYMTGFTTGAEITVRDAQGVSHVCILTDISEHSLPIGITVNFKHGKQYE